MLLSGVKREEGIQVDVICRLLWCKFPAVTCRSTTSYAVPVTGLCLESTVISTED